VDAHVDDFGRRWASAWGDCKPISYQLRGCLADQWVRFHSLPESQRYAESEEQYTEILYRHDPERRGTSATADRIADGA
jgi:hypothetical protein